MKTFLTKRKSVQAEQFWPEVKPWPASVWSIVHHGETQAYFFGRPEDWHRIYPGDWVVCDGGEYHHVRQQDFNEQYEPDECITA